MQEPNIERLVDDDRERGIFRVHRTAFTDPSILEREHAEIFDRCWLYAGHESELSKPGDYVTRKVGGRPLLLTCDPNGQRHAFINSCTHRGNAVCREKSGNARVFTCFYHAWSFNTEGALVGLPGEDAYTAAFDKKQMGLKSVPRFESYRGMMFVSFDPDTVDLQTYLGGARDYIDAMLDYGGDDVEVVPGAQSYSMRANWKLLVENSVDAYHLMSTHQRYFRNFLPDIGMDPTKWMGPGAMKATRGIALPNGHGLVESPALPTPVTVSAEAELNSIRSNLDEKFGKERAHWIADYSRNVFIYPNLILISMWRTVRTFYPVSPDFIEIDAWALLPKNESKELRQRRFENFISFLGPAGFGTPDDVSGLEGCQRGFAAHKEAEWSDISRGMGREPLATDELQMRAFWRRWHAMMRGITGPTNCSDNPVAAAA
ncbi:p-cumate 2,3-dioxygenase alpha subunit [Variovorax sp. HW608]|uniref:aromatic ring-hydroxylating oxygenase subunit alpha n=1 Tax=Variovorax sp. HW608 TaxID=1034889 RepID=UPI00081FF474|nr:aromatic ring-hydroxylating dioxygenase subunit alpha [Variovorax sp. HW608]SCK15078.1 p-cumate 2,3-dioxygenase alpha subunit [Variovorax sp. HW608]